CTSTTNWSATCNRAPAWPLNLQPGAVDVRLAPNGPGDACRNGMTILAGQTLTLRAGEIRNLRITLGAGGLYLAPVADGY
ncbi:hypothetical protein NAG17_19080, partial [Pseudomonas aeruginosa]|nr:hypothetical protein [Pseudomonas aeruginosa]